MKNVCRLQWGIPRNERSYLCKNGKKIFEAPIILFCTKAFFCVCNKVNLLLPLTAFFRWSRQCLEQVILILFRELKAVDYRGNL